MSIYSGFSTRQLQQNYNNVLLKIIALLQMEILENISKEEYLPSFPSKKLITFSSRIVKLTNKLKSYQERKYHPPKYSCALQKLISKISDINLTKPNSCEIDHPTQKSNHILMKPRGTFGKYDNSEELTSVFQKQQQSLQKPHHQNQIKLEKSFKQNKQKWISLEDSKVSSNSKGELNGNKHFRTQLKNYLRKTNYFQKDFTAPIVNQFEPEKPKLDLVDISYEKLISTSQNPKDTTEEFHHQQFKGFAKKFETRNPIIFNIHHKLNKTVDPHKKRVKTQYESYKKDDQRYFKL